MATSAVFMRVLDLDNLEVFFHRKFLMYVYFSFIHGGWTIKVLLCIFCVPLEMSYDYWDKIACTHYANLFWKSTVTTINNIELHAKCN